MSGTHRSGTARAEVTARIPSMLKRHQPELRRGLALLAISPVSIYADVKALPDWTKVHFRFSVGDIKDVENLRIKHSTFTYEVIAAALLLASRDRSSPLYQEEAVEPMAPPGIDEEDEEFGAPDDILFTEDSGDDGSDRLSEI